MRGSVLKVTDGKGAELVRALCLHFDVASRKVLDKLDYHALIQLW
jgi:hypothetical protein